MGLIIFAVIIGILFMLADIFQEYYFIDRETGDILFYYDNNYDYGRKKKGGKNVHARFKRYFR